MKRMNLMIDEALLKEARKTLDAESLSEAVNKALAEVLRIANIKKMVDLFGQVEWEGDLSEMREDTKSKKRRDAKR